MRSLFYVMHIKLFFSIFYHRKTYSKIFMYLTTVEIKKKTLQNIWKRKNEKIDDSHVI